MANKYTETDLILNPDGSVYHLNLMPKHVAETVITVGDPSRVNQIAEFFDDILYEINKREFVTITGTYKKKKITVVSTGIGADNLEIFFNEFDALFNFDLKKREAKAKTKSINLIRLGTSGAIQNDIEIGSYFISEYAIGLDNLVHYYPLEMTLDEKSLVESLSEKVKMPAEPYIVRADQNLLNTFKSEFDTGNIVTTPGFYAPQGRMSRIPHKYPTLIDDFTFFHNGEFWINQLDMETSAYYAFARIFGHNAISINAVLGNRISHTFSKDTVKVFDQLIKKVLDIIYKSDL